MVELNVLSRVECGENELVLHGDCLKNAISLTIGNTDVNLTIGSTIPLLTVEFINTLNIPCQISTTQAERFTYAVFDAHSPAFKLQNDEFGEDYDMISWQALDFIEFASNPDIKKIRMELIMLKARRYADKTDNPCVVLVKGSVKFADSMRDDNPCKLSRIRMMQSSLTIPAPPPRMPKFTSWTRFITAFLGLILLGVILRIYAMWSVTRIAGSLSIVTLLLLTKTRRRYFAISTGNVFFMNGWQAWSYSAAVQQGEVAPVYLMPTTCVKGFHAGSGALDVNLNSSSSNTGKHHIASDLFTCIANTCTKKGICLGFLSQKQQFGYIISDDSYRNISVCCDGDGVFIRGGGCISTDWLAIHLQPTLPIDVFDVYFSLAGAFSQSKLSAAYTPVGWCSWYHFFEKVSEHDLYENIKKMDDMQVRYALSERKLLFQIDDGYQDSWGDWLSLSQKRFPSQSMPSLVRAIKQSSMTPGVWAAPFACDKHSALARDHPTWILKKGLTSTPANSGNCGKWFYGLDVTNPAVQNFVRSTLEVAVNEWGFEYLKLDFLYAAALEHTQASYHNRYLTRAQAMQLGMDLIHSIEGANKLFILGCGAPLGSVIGRVHANRISADAGLSWFPEFPLPHDSWNLPCARNMVRNSICRLGMHNKWWINDPDCILLRTTTLFSDAEIIGIATVKALSGGSIIISDDLASVPLERLKVAQSILPPLGLAAVAVDLLDREIPEVLRLKVPTSQHGEGWIVMGLCNWGRISKTHQIAPQLICFDEHAELDTSKIILAFDFWRCRWFSLTTDSNSLGLLEIPIIIPSHSAALVAFRSLEDEGAPMYIGSNMHFTCGHELHSFTHTLENGKGELHLDFKREFVRHEEWNGTVWVYLPVKLHEVNLEFLEVRGEEILDKGCLWGHCAIEGSVGHGSIVRVSLSNWHGSLLRLISTEEAANNELHKILRLTILWQV